MLVMKFGGTSVGDPERIKVACEMVGRQLERDPLVVVSAHSRVTDMLVDAANKALEGDPLSGFAAIHDRHAEIVQGLGVDEALIADELNQLNELLRGIYLVKELTLRTLDFVMSFGERMSAKTFAECLRKRGLKAVMVPSYDLGLLTDGKFGSARPLPEAEGRIAEMVRSYGEALIVTTGFLGKNLAGDVTTLGRGGSDYSASIFGGALGAEEIQVWKDVDGVLTADPSVVEGAEPIERLTFWEAAEVARFGGTILHPSTMEPAVRHGIPVRVLNTFRPEAKGTVILPTIEAEGSRIKSIVYKEDIILINVRTTMMLFRPGFMAKLFSIFGKYDIDIDMIATSEVSVSLTTTTTRNLDVAIAEIEEFAEVAVDRGKAIICVVGTGMRHTVGLASRIFGTVAAAKVSVEMISQAANEINVAFLVDNGEIERVVRALHAEIFKTGRG